MIPHFILSFLLICSFLGNAQTLKKTVPLDAALKETSGLVFVNSKLYSHNDSGGLAELYEVDTSTGVVSRTISIENATNVDWEDVAYDDTYLYIADIGNNSGTRTDLKIYKVVLSDLAIKNTVTAEIISFGYKDQIDFTSALNANDFDAEALIAYSNKLYIFTKNWVSQKTSVYELSTTPGSYVIEKKETLNVGGLITGATVRGDKLLLSGYSLSLYSVPFVYEIEDVSLTNFSSGKETKTTLPLPVTSSSQIEGITFLDDENYYVSAEEDPIKRTSSLFLFTTNTTTLANKTLEKDLNDIKVEFVNQNEVIVKTNEIQEFSVYSVEGRLLFNGVTNTLVSVAECKNKIVIVVLENGNRFKYLF